MFDRKPNPTKIPINQNPLRRTSPRFRWLVHLTDSRWGVTDTSSRRPSLHPPGHPSTASERARNVVHFRSACRNAQLGQCLPLRYHFMSPSGNFQLRNNCSYQFTLADLSSRWYRWWPFFFSPVLVWRKRSLLLEGDDLIVGNIRAQDDVIVDTLFVKWDSSVLLSDDAFHLV